MNIKFFNYPNYQKVVNLIFLLIFVIAATIVPILALLGLLLNNNPIIEKLIAVAASILFAFFFILIAVVINIMTPDIKARSDGFQLSTILYHSQWIKWQEIQFIKESILSKKRYKVQGIGIDQINPIYFLVGLTQGLGGRAFLITEKICGYDNLMKLLEENRPDLF